MISNSSNEKISCLLPRHTSMQSYIVQSKMQFPGECMGHRFGNHCSFLLVKYNNSCIQLYWKDI